jgi:hypothetical protein
MLTVNGKQYPLWSQFVERKDEWIGGLLHDEGDAIDKMLCDPVGPTIITDIKLEPNGADSAYFLVDGEDYSCGFDVRYGGVIGGAKGKDWISFSGYGGHTWHIKQREVKA